MDFLGESRRRKPGNPKSERVKGDSWYDVEHGLPAELYSIEGLNLNRRLEFNPDIWQCSSAEMKFILYLSL